MRRTFLFALLALLVLALPADAKKPKKKKQAQTAELVAETPQLKTHSDSISYLFGTVNSRGLREYAAKQLGVDSTHMGDFVRGIMDRVNTSAADSAQLAYDAGLEIGKQIEQMTRQVSKEYYAADPDSALDSRLVASAIVNGLLRNDMAAADSAARQFQTVMNSRQQQNKERLYGANREAGEAFLAENAKKDGVVTLPSGLQYKVLTQGTGAVPTAKQKVKVNYEGHLIDGTEFDSSYKRSQPATFQANRVIAGWTEALCLMPVGSKWELYIPYQLAYGERETGKIKPYSALIFTVELLGIEDDAPAATTAKPAATTDSKKTTAKTKGTAKK